jgi:hypothetical protein
MISMVQFIGFDYYVSLQVVYCIIDMAIWDYGINDYGNLADHRRFASGYFDQIIAHNPRLSAIMSVYWFDGFQCTEDGNATLNANLATIDYYAMKKLFGPQGRLHNVSLLSMSLGHFAPLLGAPLTTSLRAILPIRTRQAPWCSQTSLRGSSSNRLKKSYQGFATGRKTHCLKNLRSTTAKLTWIRKLAELLCTSKN